MRITGTSVAAAFVVTSLLLAGCGSQDPGENAAPADPAGKPAVQEAGAQPPAAKSEEDSERDVYAATRPGNLSPAMEGVLNRVYVPNSVSNTVSIIDPSTFKVIDTIPGGLEPQHVVPSYDLKTLYVTADEVPGGTLTPIDPKTGKAGELIHVQDPYNLYFTPDGKSAMVVAEAYKRLDFYDPHTWRKQDSLHVDECAGINHMDFTKDGKLALVTCEFANRMIVVDVEAKKHIRTFELDQTAHGMPQDSRLSPDGKTFYVADMHANGIYLFDGDATKQIGFVPTGQGAHGVYFSRDSKRAFITNRGEGSVTILDTSTNKPVDKWHIPGGGSPDMGAVSADGKQLWLSGRHHNEVYVLDTGNGNLIARIPVGSGPHGLTYMPQPGRYSLGHTSNIR
ncbi:YncE family protein [Saccharomonospora sp. NPDC006951]